MKFCAFLFAAMMASASAFAPSSKAISTTALNQAIDYNPNLGGATSNDPVDQTLMNMVRSVLYFMFHCLQCRCLSPRVQSDPIRFDWHHWRFLSFFLLLIGSPIVFFSPNRLSFPPPFYTPYINGISQTNNTFRIGWLRFSPLSLLCDRYSSQRTSPSAKCKEEEPSEPGTSPQRPSVFLTTSAPTGVP